MDKWGSENKIKWEKGGERGTNMVLNCTFGPLLLFGII